MKKIIVGTIFFLAVFEAYCQTPLYSGGISDGAAISCYAQLAPLASSAIYNGGIEDGFSMSSFTESTSFSIYSGGNSDGFTSMCYEQGLTVVFGIFTGGNGDGSGKQCFEQSPALGSDFFKGGDGDGFARLCFTQSAALGTNIFYGGDHDGFSPGCYLQNIALGGEVFLGGNGDGFDNHSYEQDLTLFFGLFTGGDGDGYDKAYYEQPDYLNGLPIELASFEAIPIAKSHVQLIWQTKSEINNDYFVVERSTDITRWEPIMQIEGAGNSVAQINYSAVDYQPYSGKSYYRLKQVDYDGTFSYSFIRSVELALSQDLLNEFLIYPNPADQSVNLQFTNFSKDNLQLIIYNAQGSLVFKRSLKLQNGNGLYNLQDVPELTSGYYAVIVTDGQLKYQKRLIIR